MSEDNTSAEELLKQVRAASEDIERRINQRIDEQQVHLEKRIDTNEELVAHLMQAYVEMHTALNRTIEELMSPKDESEREQFRRDLTKRHAQAMKMLEGLAHDVAEQSEEHSSSSILDMAARQHANKTQQQGDDAADSEGKGPASS